MENSSQSDELQVFLWGIGLISVFTLILYGLSHAMEKKALVKRERNSSRIYGILNEINQRKQSEEALKKSYESYKRQIELSSESIIILTKENIVFANNEALNLFGAKSMDEIIDKSLLDFIHPDYKYITTHRIQRIYEEEEKVALIDEQFIHQNGDIIDIEVTAILVDYFGMPSVQMIVRDITERRKNEEMYVTFKRANIYY
jgi:PAS domain S-box-containing protein